MKNDRSDASPALRLGVLYVASFFTIALLTGISQVYVLRELSWQSMAIASVAHSSAEPAPPARNLVDRQGWAARGPANAIAQEAAGRIRQLESFEYILFGLVLAVLIVEGLFVVNPAVLKIRQIMEDMRRSHDELKFYAKKLERSNRELQDFASVASHDLQEPLRKIQAFSDRLRSKCAGALDEQGRDYLDRIQNAAGRMQTLINDLLTYARVATKARPFVTDRPGRDHPRGGV